MTLDEAYVRFGTALDQRHYAPSTRRAYRDHLRGFLRWLGPDAGLRALTSVTRAELARYQDGLASGALAKESQALKLRAVKRWFEWAVDRGYLFESPASRLVETPPGHRRLPPVPTQDEMKHMLAVPNTSLTGGIRDRAILEVLYATGLRRNELIALDVFDVDLDTALVQVRSGKGRKGRVVRLTTEATRWLRTYLDRVRPRYQPPRRGEPLRGEPRPGATRGGEPRGGERALFVDVRGRRIGGDAVRRAVRAAARGAQITTPIRVHSFRHAMATHLREAGASIVVIQKLLGHSSPAITSALYTRVRPIEVKAEHARTHPRERGAAAAEVLPPVSLASRAASPSQEDPEENTP